MFNGRWEGVRCRQDGAVDGAGFSSRLTGMWLLRGAAFLEGDFVQYASEKAWRVCVWGGGGVQKAGDG